MIELIPSVKLSMWRKDDPDHDKSDDAFAIIKPKVYTRDRMICQGCGMKTLPSDVLPSGHFDVHHIDDDHDNNNMDNLALICPYCHDVFHIGNAGARGAGSAIWLPQISQADLNLSMHILTILMIRGENADKELKAIEAGPTPGNAEVMRLLAQDRDVGAKCADNYKSIKDSAYRDEIEKRLAPGMSDLRQLGEALSWMGHRNRDTYNQRKKFLYGVRIVPDFDHYRDKIKHFAEASNYNRTGASQIVAAETMSSIWTQWKTRSA